MTDIGSRPTLRAPVPPGSDDWVGILDGDLPLASALAWAGRADCGAVVTFSGAVRDHSHSRHDVTSLEYEAYEPYATRAMAAVAQRARWRQPEVRRIALLHRVGILGVGDTAVVVVVSAPHRAEAYDASRFCIDTVKSTVPIWKCETWAGGSSWDTCSHGNDPRGGAAR